MTSLISIIAIAFAIASVALNVITLRRMKASERGMQNTIRKELRPRGLMGHLR